MIILLKHCKNNKMLLRSGESLLDLDFKVEIVIRTYCCVEFAILEDSLIFHRVSIPMGLYLESLVIHSAFRNWCSIILFIIFTYQLFSIRPISFEEFCQRKGVPTSAKYSIFYSDGSLLPSVLFYVKVAMTKLIF